MVVALVFSVYAAVLLATVDGVIRAFRERYLPPWVVGLAAALLLGVIHELIGTPFGSMGALLAIPGGIAAGGIYGLRRRRASVP